jgi:hypothetical protein
LGKLGVKRHNSKLLTVLLAFVLPGAGHLYTGRHPAGVLLAAAFLLDITAIIRLADSDGGRHLLLIVYLALLLPLFYFYSVFDSLQSLEREAADDGEPAAFRLSHGLLLLGAGLLMLVMVRPPELLLPWMNELAELSVGPGIALIAFGLLRSGKGSMFMFKLGRFTAAGLILAIGALLLWDQLKGRNDIALFGQWWPVIFIALGLEIVLFSLIFRNEKKKMKLDASGAVIATVIAVTAYSVTQYADFPVRWLDQFNVDLSGTSEYGDEKGFQYDKAVIKLPYEESLSLMHIVNANGQVKVLSADVQEIEVQATVWVDVENEADAEAIAEQSIVKVTPGAEVVLEAKGKEFGTNGNRKPWMNIVVTVPLAMSDQYAIDSQLPPSDEPSGEAENELDGELPANESSAAGVNEAASPISETAETTSEDGRTIENVQTEDAGEAAWLTPTPSPTTTPEPTLDTEEQLKLKMKIDSGNGPIEVAELGVPGGLEIRSTTGVITVRNIIGPVTVKGNIGNIEAEGIAGESSLETRNGTIKATDIAGKLYANTLNGSLELGGIGDDVQAETKNGRIRIVSASGSVKADTLNGSIELTSAVVGGDWDLDSSVGEIKLAMPVDGDFKVYGSVTFGTITTDLPLDISKKTVRGTIGTGTYRVQINATNSIAIKSYTAP